MNGKPIESLEDFDRIIDKLERMELLPNEVLILKSRDVRDAHELARVMEIKGYSNIIFWMSNGVELEKTEEDKILEMADEIRKRRENGSVQAS